MGRLRGKKIKLNKKLKIGLIGLLVVAIGFTSFLLYNEVKNPGFKEEKVAVYSYKSKGNAEYEVFLKPNILYEEKSLGEDQTYFTEYLDYINASLSYEFNGERAADISGDYEVVAIVEGFVSGDQDKILTLWKKGFILSPKEKFNVKDSKLKLTKEIKFNLDKYNTFVELIREETKVQTQTKLSIMMNVNLVANTDKGMIEEKGTPAIELPLTASNFNIAKNIGEEKEGAIEETLNVQLPLNKPQIIVYSSLLTVMLLGLLFVILFIKGINRNNVLLKEVKKIFKNHGPRLVALSSDVARGWKKYHKVYSIDDLVKVADELEKPIMYKYSPDMAEINYFYVFDDSFIYVFDLSEKVNGSKHDQFKNLNYLENSFENGDSSSSSL